MEKPKRILFVCVENSCRSQMAEAFARIHGGDKVIAESGGSRPSGKVNEKAIISLKELGYDLTKHESKGLPEEGVVDVVVSMGCGEACPYVKTKKRIAWEIPDPKEKPQKEFNETRDLIEEKVKALLKELNIL